MNRTSRTRSAALAAVLGSIALAAGAGTAQAAGQPATNSNSHLNIRIPVTCDGEQLTVVAGDSAHAVAQIVDGGTGHLIPVSMTFTMPDGTSETEQLGRHPHQPTVTCAGTDVGGSGMTITIVAVRK